MVPVQEGEKNNICDNMGVGDMCDDEANLCTYAEIRVRA